MSIKINRIQHTGMPVTDIKRSEAFYNRLGFENVMSATFQYNGGTGTVAMMQRDDMILELYQMPEAELAEIRSRGNGHIDHIAFDVDDIDASFAEVKAAGFGILEDEPTFLAFWKQGTKFFFITGPDGERLEFNQVL